jgi:hypothetical protein
MTPTTLTVRPELYRDLAFYRAPVDERASKHSHRVKAALAQYTPATGNPRANFERIQKLLDAAVVKPNLVVAPAYSLTGVPADLAGGRPHGPGSNKTGGLFRFCACDTARGDAGPGQLFRLFSP